MKYFIYRVAGTTKESPPYVVRMTKTGAKFCSFYSDWHDDYHLAIGLYNGDDDAFTEVSKEEALKILDAWGRKDLPEDA